MVKIGASSKQRSEVIEIVSIFRAKVVDVSPKSMIVEVTGSEGKVEAFVDMMRPFGILELVRTGEIVQQLKEIPGVAGVHIMSIGWEAAVPRVVEEAGLLPRPEVADPRPAQPTGGSG